MISGRLRPFSNDFTGEELLPRSIATSHDKGAYRGTPNHLKIGCAKIWIFQLPSTQENYLLVEIFSSWYKNLRSTIAKTFWTDEFKTKKNWKKKFSNFFFVFLKKFQIKMYFGVGWKRKSKVILHLSERN